MSVHQLIHDCLMGFGDAVLWFYIPHVSVFMMFTTVGLFSILVPLEAYALYYLYFMGTSRYVDVAKRMERHAESESSMNELMVDHVVKDSDRLFRYNNYLSATRIVEYVLFFITSVNLLGGMLAVHYMSATPLEQNVISVFILIFITLLIVNSLFSIVVKDFKEFTLQYLKDRGVGDIVLNAIANSGGLVFKDLKLADNRRKLWTQY